MPKEIQIKLDEEIIRQLSDVMPKYVEAVGEAVKQKAELLTNIDTFYGHGASMFVLAMAYALQVGVRVSLIPDTEISDGKNVVIYGTVDTSKENAQP